ncbi:retrotransposon ty1-copia subclass [Lasius niger]|uniref:Retrotransposon ty1-copia subclass n=1 Tax=Lasius niger TaxID=67767 RepID=A0A0J7N0W5_LASNI|nr:retrotransposon ty1-copia subclass [Lasius niger]
MNSDNEEPMDPTNRKADIEQIKDSSNKEEPAKHDVRTLRPRDTIKLPTRYGHAMLAIEEPQMYAEAISSPEAEQWKKAIRGD